MANIGVVTFSNTLDNYGQVLQYLAIQEYLKDRSHNVFLLRDTAHRQISLLKILCKIERIINKIKKHIFCYHKDPILSIYDQWAQSVIRNEKNNPRGFEVFRQSCFKIIGNTPKELKNNSISVLCVGSDQIWSSVGDYQFLAFGTNEMIRISIAPSIGLAKFSLFEKKLVGKYLKRFSFVTTREDSGVKICKDVGYSNVRKILDPTFLLSPHIYTHFSSNDFIINNCIFVYLLGAECELSLKSIETFAKNRGLEVKYVGSQGREDESNNKIYASIPQWIELMNKSTYIITNSFHGMAFSIIFKKQFMVLPITGITKGMNERIYNLASEMDLGKRIYSGNLDVLFEPIDFSKASTLLQENKSCLNQLMELVHL